MLVHNVSGPALDVALPVWRPGKYAVLNPAGSVSGVRAQASTGEPLTISKLDKTTWRVQTNGAHDVEVFYTLYANSLNDRTRHVDDTHAFLSGATVFFYVPDRRNDPLSLQLQAPQNWKIACGLEHAPNDPTTLLAPSYDVLIDSPIEIGVHDVLHFQVRGVPHEIVIWGEAQYDRSRLTSDFAKIVETQAALFGGIPYERYLFLIHIGPGLGGGTEHVNSTIMQTPARAFEDEDNYQKLLSLASHELFHAWNVKRLRPAALRTIDFAKENYTDLLWFCEGTTSYYDDLFVVRAGLNSPDAYLKTLGEAIHQLRSRPGSRVQSLAESSFDAWIKFNQPSPDDVNSTVSYYDNGALASLLLDLELRKRTANRVSLDAVMREMHERFPDSGPGFTTDDLIEMASRLSQTRFEEFFDRYIQGTDAYPFEDVLDVVGLTLSRSNQVPGVDGARAYIGLNLQDLNGCASVRYVLSDGPAYTAGVLVGDEIVAMNGRRFSSSDLLGHVERRMQPGDRVQLHLIRRNRLRILDFQLASKPSGRWKLLRRTDATAAQKAAYTDWLHHSWE
jgi:predicted metalloprotease with PDZ domain